MGGGADGVTVMAGQGSGRAGGRIGGRSPEDARRLRVKNLALLAVLLGFVVLVYLISIVRMGGG